MARIEEHAPSKKVEKYLRWAIAIILVVVMGSIVAASVKLPSLSYQAAASRADSRTVTVELQGEDALSEAVDIYAYPIGWQYRFEAPLKIQSRVKAHYDDGTMGPITKNFGAKGRFVQFSGPAGGEVTITFFHP